ncbi:hypothetical protein BVI2075_160057 [Burkholderia vietnamiensis]|nr:hypothetical protein BVI2075_160057 [Burkholderia vietnamiensis]
MHNDRVEGTHARRHSSHRLMAMASGQHSTPMPSELANGTPDGSLSMTYANHPAKIPMLPTAPRFAVSCMRLARRATCKSCGQRSTYHCALTGLPFSVRVLPSYTYVIRVRAARFRSAAGSESPAKPGIMTTSVSDTVSIFTRSEQEPNSGLTV